MLHAWRIVKTKYAAAAFDGEGARRFGGRWTSPGRRAVYVSGTGSLAVLEMLVHLNAWAPLAAYSLFEVQIPEALVTEVAPASLPRGWREYPAPAELRRMGDGWLEERASAALRVPSAIVPLEFNFVLNPEHPDFGRIKVGAEQPVEVDARLIH